MLASEGGLLPPPTLAILNIVVHLSITLLVIITWLLSSSPKWYEA
jgi:hypothetical protein